MPIGGKKIAGDIVGGLKGEVAKAMDDCRLQIAGAVTELVNEIKDGTKQVVRAVHSEADGVRREFAEIVGNAEFAAEDAIEQAKKTIEANEGVRPTNGPAQ